MMLHDHVLTLEGYKVRLLLAFLGLRFDTTVLDVLVEREHRRPGFAQFSPTGELPVLVDGDIKVSGAEAILVYLARAYGTDWLPGEPGVAEWLGFALGPLSAASIVRSARLFEDNADESLVAAATASVSRAYRLLDDHLIRRELAGKGWIAAERPTIADLACFPAVALFDDVGVPLDRYHGLIRWAARLSDLPGFVMMPGVFALSGEIET